ncbi:hypothetical protein TcasGA2_TC032810 [Tribolium castaneum]|uniref:Uncharacterized protein n=1 Tax=Tribolium castaneum TaxID=7070 RepID=A0A139WIV6_TRICA|nr:hypothetical protein TcasGA2_TC032810 [Tribolium castaneum]
MGTGTGVDWTWTTAVNGVNKPGAPVGLGSPAPTADRTARTIGPREPEQARRHFLPLCATEIHPTKS